jgi:hypothetical protein
VPGEAFTVAAIDHFIDLAAKASGNSPEVVASKLQQSFLRVYLSRAGAQTIVCEHAYVEYDFLEDFAAYYVSCFHPYDSRCARLHFFSTTFKQRDLEQLLAGRQSSLTPEGLNAAYLGFIVVKPLPHRFIGRTCLTTQRLPAEYCFPACHNYEANLFGIPLTVRRTIPFQEKDSVVAACATSALWSVFHATGRIFHHAIPSSVRITRSATEQFPLENRVLPSKGLHPGMIAQAIRSVGLEPYMVDAKNLFVLQGTVYAYLRGRIPLVLGLELLNKKLGARSRRRSLGKHAVAVTGYQLSAAPIPYGRSGFLLRASRIESLLVHDDQIGPFAPMTLPRRRARSSERGASQVGLGTLWPTANGEIGKIIGVGWLLMIPLYNKIRIPYEFVLDAVVHFDRICAVMSEKAKLPLRMNLEWDVYLTTVNDLKTDLLKQTLVRGDVLKDVLTAAMPRFIWRATACHQERPVFDLFFDATDIESGALVVRVLKRMHLLCTILTNVANRKTDVESIQKHYGDQPAKILSAFATRDAGAAA